MSEPTLSPEREAELRERRNWASYNMQDASELFTELDRVRARLAAAEKERDDRQRFKDWVHNYLDTHGVPHHPPGTHGAEGCRIGDRMDWLFAEFTKSLQAVAELVAGLKDAKSFISSVVLASIMGIKPIAEAESEVNRTVDGLVALIAKHKAPK